MSEVFNITPEFTPKLQKPQLCKFCGGQATYAPLEQMEDFGIKVFFCHPCGAEYLYYSREETPTTYASVSLYTEVKNKMYRWTVFDDGNRSTLWWVKDPGVPGSRINKDLVAILMFSEAMPEVTPQTIQTKVQIWLPFL
jgi:hypothetical protein